MNFRRLRAIARKEVLHIIRDPRSLASALIAIPLLMLLLFGYALSLDVDRIPDHRLRPGPAARRARTWFSDFRGSRYFQIIEARTTATAPSNGRWIRGAPCWAS